MMVTAREEIMYITFCTHNDIMGTVLSGSHTMLSQLHYQPYTVVRVYHLTTLYVCTLSINMYLFIL